MSEFLMVIPEGWVELENPQALIDQAGAEWFAGVIANNTLYEIDQLLEQLGINRPGFVLDGFRLINAGAGYRIWASFAAEV